MISCPIALGLGEVGHCGIYYSFSSYYNQIFDKKQLKWEKELL